jgi:hypothetical protein
MNRKVEMSDLDVGLIFGDSSAAYQIIGADSPTFTFTVCQVSSVDNFYLGNVFDFVDIQTILVYDYLEYDEFGLPNIEKEEEKQKKPSDDEDRWIKKPPICECGAEKCGMPYHSYWCPLFEGTKTGGDPYEVD